MLKNYIKTAFRNLWRAKTYSLINIVGLSVGLASCFIILLYSVHEMSYDRYDKKLDRIYLATMDFGFKNEGWTEPLVPFPAGPAMKAELAEVEEFARCILRPCNIEYGGKALDAIRCASADSSLFRVLTLPIVDGNLKEAFAERNYAIISRGLAKRLFGSGGAIGQVIDVNWGGRKNYFTVSAVMANIPSTSTFKADCILPITAEENSISREYPTIPGIFDRWWPPTVYTYLLLHGEKSAGPLKEKLAKFSDEHAQFPTMPHSLHLIALRDFYFRPETLVNTYWFPKGNLQDVEIYSGVALLILLIACVNFVILSTGRASVRTKEIGVQKVVGASKLDIAKQSLTESLLVSLISLPIALLLVELFMPSITTLLGKRLPVDYNRSLQAVLLYIGVTILAGILSGSYVSFYLSGLHPAEILKNKFSRGRGRVTVRRILVGFQMVVFVGLILTSITIYRQMRYTHTKDMGYNDRNLIVFSRLTNDRADTVLGNRYDAFASNLDTISDVASVTCGDFVPGTEGTTQQQDHSYIDPQKLVLVDVLWVGRDYFNALGMKIVSGKTFAEVPSEEAKDCVIMNQEAVKELGIINPSQEMFNDHRILGIVKDFNLQSLRKQILPAVFYDESKDLQEIAVRLKHMKGAQQTISSVEKLIEELDGGRRFKHQFFDDRISAMYGSDYKFADMIGYFTGLAVFIACLGLFGMSLFVIQRRVKEIAVRKVLGASVTSVLFSTAKEFVMTLFVAAVLSVPISIYFADKWLDGYAYHINVNVISIAIAILVGLSIVLLTVGYQVLKAATMNPVESLRYE